MKVLLGSYMVAQLGLAVVEAGGMAEVPVAVLVLPTVLLVLSLAAMWLCHLATSNMLDDEVGGLVDIDEGDLDEDYVHEDYVHEVRVHGDRNRERLSE